MAPSTRAGRDLAVTPRRSVAADDRWWSGLRRPLDSPVLAGAVWAVGALVSLLLIALTVRHAVGEHDLWLTATGRLLDYRDTVVQPAHFLLHGGNPYDPDTYLRAYPWSQEFDPYAPWWLLFTFPLGLLPLKVGGAIFVTALYAAEAWLAIRLTRFAWPEAGRVVAPTIYLWLLLWPPTRFVGASTLIVVAIASLLLVVDERDNDGWHAACMLAVCWLKPQFGVPLSFFFLVGRRWRLLARSLVVLLVSSLVPLVVVARNAGGPAGLVDAVRRDVNYASSGKAPTGLESAVNFRTDVPGVLARVGYQMPTGLQLVFMAVVVLATSWVVLRRPRGTIGVTVMTLAVLILPVHSDYDMALCLVATASSIHVWRRLRSDASLLLMALCAVPVLHQHSVTQSLLRVGIAPLEAADTAVLCGAFVVAILIGLSKRTESEHGRLVAA